MTSERPEIALGARRSHASTIPGSRRPGPHRRPGPRHRREGDRPRPARGGAGDRPREPATRSDRRSARPSAQGAEQSGLSRLIDLHAANAAGDAAVAISLATTRLLRRRHQRGARPGGAVPRPDDAAVRDRGAADRPVPRPVQPRPALGDRGDLRDPRVPVLGAGGRGRRRLGAALSRRARRTRRVQGVRRDPRRRRTPPAAGRASRWSRPTAGSRSPAWSARRSPRRSPALAASVGSEWALRYAFLVFVLGTIAAIRLPEKVDSSAGEQQISLRAERQVSAAAPRSRRRSPSRSAPTAGRAGCRAS